MSINQGNQSSTINPVTEHVATLQYNGCDITVRGDSKSVRQVLSTLLPEASFEINQGNAGTATFVFQGGQYLGCINPLTVAEQQSATWTQKNQAQAGFGMRKTA